jgi:membrane protein DedA with SNARE-associated domain/rhodanese-related sulfurtransferase
MTDIQEALVAYGPLLVFFNVLLEQAGLPIPAYPLLIMAGALIAHQDLSWPVVLACAMLGCVIADTGWYLAGRRFGDGLLKTVCRVSASRDVCISQTQGLYMKVGLRILVVAKFLPGAGALATVMAGLTRAPFSRFLIYELTGALIWTGSALLLGFIFNDAVGGVLEMLSIYGTWGLGLFAVALIIYIGVRLARRRLAVRRYRHIPRLLPEELHEWRVAARPHHVVDVRSYASERIPGAVFADAQTDLATLALTPGNTVVVYCDCPEEISAAMFADRVRMAGHKDVAVLLGGYTAWAKLPCVAVVNVADDDMAVVQAVKG